MLSQQLEDVDATAFAPTLVSNLLPLVGVVFLQWRLVEVLAVYWLEIGTTFLVYGVAALFAKRPVILEGRNLHLPGVDRHVDRREKWDREPNPVEVPGPLPPVYPRNVRLVRMSLIWGFGFLVLPLIGKWELVRSVLSVSLVLTAATMVLAQLNRLRKRFFGERRYEAVSAHMVLEIPGRLLFFAVCYIAVVALVGAGGIVVVGLLVQETVGYTLPSDVYGLFFGTAMVVGKVAVEWSRFRAENESDPTGFATWFLPEDPRAKQ